MTTEISVTLDVETRDKIEDYVKRGYFDDVQEFVAVAVRQLLYELSLENAEWPRRTGLSEREIEDELDEIRRVQRSRPGDDPGIQS